MATTGEGSGGSGLDLLTLTLGLWAAGTNGYDEVAGFGRGDADEAESHASQHGAVPGRRLGRYGQDE